MKQIRAGIAFTDLLEKLLKGLGFDVQIEASIPSPDRRIYVDLVISKAEYSTWTEIKLYRDERVNTNNIRIAAAQLLDNLRFSSGNVTGLLIVSTYISSVVKEGIKQDFEIVIWDRSDIYNLIKYNLEDGVLLDEFEQVLLEVKQGIDTQDVFEKVEPPKEKLEDYFELLIAPITKGVFTQQLPPSRGNTLCKELNAIPKGKPGWRQYEEKCIEILKYIFGTELANWDAQNTTDDELSRFDMICRIVQQTGFWGTLIQSFRTRFVLFEFKNYTDPIGQDQIYTTERYLYLQGLRSVGFIISREGGKPQAIKASKGALREHGKLIIILTNQDLCKMLDMKDSGDNPSDYLSNILDKFLISLSR